MSFSWGDQQHNVADLMSQTEHSEVRFVYSQPISYEKPYVDANGSPLSTFTDSDASQLYGAQRYNMVRCDKDGSLDNRLAIAPNLEIALLNEHKRALVFRGTRKILFKSNISLDLLPLLAKGELNGYQLAEQLKDKYPRSLDVHIALYNLLSKDVIVCADYELTATQALFWAMAGLTPCAAEQRLDALPLHMTTLTDKPFPVSLRAKMQELGGWRHVDYPEDAAMIIYLVDSYQQENIAAVNARHLADGKKWLLLQLRDDTSMCGPIFCSAPHSSITNQPCWECLRVAIDAGDNNLDSLLQSTSHKLLPRPTTHATLHHDMMASCLNTELSAMIYGDEVRAALRSHLLLSSLPKMTREYHWVAQRPQCPACSPDALRWSHQRSPQPLQLKHQKATVFTSGGIRTRSSQQAFEQWRKYISPITGAADTITHCLGTYYDASGDEWDWYHNTVGGKNRALQHRDLKNLRKGFRDASGGKGSTATQSWVSAICEAFERSAGVFKNQNEIYRKARIYDFKDGEAIAPNTVTLFSDLQYKNRDAINKLGNPYCCVPEPFDPDRPEMWSPVWSLTEHRHKYLPTRSLYYGVENFGQQSLNAYSCSNGVGGGATIEEAVLQGFYELFERDACSIWWHNRLRLPPVVVENFPDQWLQQAKTFYAALHRELWVLDMTTDLGVPAYIALSRNTRDDRPDAIIFGFGAHLDPRIAIYRAISEMNQSLAGFELRQPKDSDYATWIREVNCPAAANWMLEVSTNDESFSWLLPDTSATPSNYPHPREFTDPVEEIDYLRSIVEDKGMEMLVVDQSRPEIDYHVAKVIVPGLRHFWRRLAPGRVYDVPVVQGKLSRPHTEEEMNPIAMFI